MKKLFTILLCGALTLTLTACGDNGTSFVFTPQSSSKTPYKEPGGNGGVTNVGDGTETSVSHKGTTASAESKAREDYEFEDDLGGVNILHYRGDGGKVSVPSMIGGKTVVQIDEHAFRGAAVTNVTIPGTVRTIETRAFTDCDKLEILTIADGVQTIDGYAFSDCAKLALVTLPDSLREVGTGAFSGCPLVQITYRGKTYTAVNIEDLYDDVMLYAF